MQRISPQVELDNMASWTPSHRPQPKTKTGSLNFAPSADSHDPEVPPYMRIRVLVCGLDIVVSVDSAAAGNCTSLGADKLIPLQIRISRHELRAGKLPSVELVSNQNLKSVENWICKVWSANACVVELVQLTQVMDPLEPRLHVRLWQDIACVDDKCKNHYTCKCHGLGNSLGHSRERSEDRRHDLPHNERDQEVDEELRWFSSKTSQEVEDQVEHNGSNKLDRYIADHTSDCFCCRMVKSVRFVLFDDWTLSIETVDLVHG